jgi:hypothetical protein
MATGFRWVGNDGHPMEEAFRQVSSGYSEGGEVREVVTGGPKKSTSFMMEMK